MLEVRRNVSDKTLCTKEEWILLSMKDRSVAYIFWKKRWFLQQLVAGGVMMLYLFKTPKSSSIPGNTHSEVVVFTCFFSLFCSESFDSVLGLLYWNIPVLLSFWHCYPYFRYSHRNSKCYLHKSFWHSRSLVLLHSHLNASLSELCNNVAVLARFTASMLDQILYREIYLHLTWP